MSRPERSVGRAVHRRPEGCAQELILDIDASDIPATRRSGAGGVSRPLRPLLLPAALRVLRQGDAACVLRRSRVDGARHAAAVIRLLVGRLRRAWPSVRIIVRGDSGFCRQRLIRFCERHGVGYVIGMARNTRLRASSSPGGRARRALAASGVQRAIHEFVYAAGSWNRERRLITRLEFGHQGINPRFVVTNLEGAAQSLYDELYCARGEAENRIKGNAAGSVRHPRELPQVSRQLAVLLAAMAHFDAAAQGTGAGRYRTGSCHGRHDSRQAAQDRRCRDPQYPPSAYSLRIKPSTA